MYIMKIIHVLLLNVFMVFRNANEFKFTTL